jgi:hypothetical protein
MCLLPTSERLKGNDGGRLPSGRPKPGRNGSKKRGQKSYRLWTKSKRHRKSKSLNRTQYEERELMVVALVELDVTAAVKFVVAVAVGSVIDVGIDVRSCGDRLIPTPRGPVSPDRTLH